MSDKDLVTRAGTGLDGAFNPAADTSLMEMGAGDDRLASLTRSMAVQRVNLDFVPLSVGDVFVVTDADVLNKALRFNDFMKGRFKIGDRIICLSGMFCGDPCDHGIFGVLHDGFEDAIVSCMQGLNFELSERNGDLSAALRYELTLNADSLKWLSEGFGVRLKGASAGAPYAGV
jgi:hypothetical protein